MALRIGFWCVLLLAVLASAYGVVQGIQRLFFAANPHFTVRNIEVEEAKGTVDVAAVRARLGVQLSRDNLFALDIGALRRRLIADPLVQEVEIRRLLPATLKLTVYGRTPVAQLLRNGGRLIDGEAVVLPSSPRRGNLSLPVITGIPDAAQFETGATLDSEMVRQALNFLALRDVSEHGRWLDVDFIQLDANYRELRVFLRGRDAQLIRDGCQLELPVRDMEKALGRALRLLELRAAAHQPTSHLNVTYERVPVSP